MSATATTTEGSGGDDERYVRVGNVRMKFATAKARLYVIGKREVWIPKSVTSADSPKYKNATGPLYVMREFAEQKGLIPDGEM